MYQLFVDTVNFLIGAFALAGVATIVAVIWKNNKR